MIEHRATKPLERHTLLVQHDEDQRPRFLAQGGGRAGAKGPVDEIVQSSQSTTASVQARHCSRLKCQLAATQPCLALRKIPNLRTHLKLELSE